MASAGTSASPSSRGEPRPPVMLASAQTARHMAVAESPWARSKRPVRESSTTASSGSATATMMLVSTAPTVPRQAR